MWSVGSWTTVSAGKFNSRWGSCNLVMVPPSDDGAPMLKRLGLKISAYFKLDKILVKRYLRQLPDMICTVHTYLQF